MGQLELKDLTFALNADPQATNFGSLKHQLEKFQYDQDSGTSKPLDAPLSKNIQQKIDRHAAYRETSKDISKWKPFIQKNRKAEHLSLEGQFENSSKISPTTSKLTASHKPQGAFEEQVSALLKASGFQCEENVAKMEAEEMNRVFSPQEIAARQKHLAKVRSMAFLHEIKQKHAAKIKSKTYHRIKKKEKLKEAVSLHLAAASAEEHQQGQSTIAEQEKILAELERAHKRLTLKGKKNVKWLKELAAATTTTQQENYAEEEAEALKMKLLQMEAEVEPEAFEDQIVEEQEPKTLFERLLVAKKSSFSPDEIQENEEWFDGGVDDEEDNANLNSKETKPSSSKKPAKMIKKEGRFTLDCGDIGDQSCSIEYSLITEKIDLMKDSMSGKIDLMKDSISEKLSSTKDSISAKLSSNLTASSGSFLPPNPQAFSLCQEEQTISIEESQRALVKRAFAADQVTEAAFEEEKTQEIEREIEEQIEKPVFLPGWGSWSGNGAVESKGAQRFKAQLQRQYEIKKQTALAKRKDFHLSHVIINEQQTTKKHNEFALSKVPYPFKSLEEYQKAMNTPIGREWSTIGAFQQTIKPKYAFKGGIVIGAPKFHHSEQK